MTTIKEITDYYVERLVIQYKDKARARATVALLTKQALADYFGVQIREAFDPATASGDALDKIAKYVGVARSIGTPVEKPFFRFIDQATESPTYVKEHGFTDYLDDTINEDALFYKIGFVELQNKDLTDYQFRQFIAMAIFRNTTNGSFSDIVSYVSRFLALWVSVVDNRDMTLTYTVSDACPLDQAALKAYLPRPMGVGIITNLASPSVSPESLSKVDIGPSSGMKTVYAGPFTASISGATAPFTYQWRLYIGYAGGAIALEAPGTNQTCRVALTVGTSPGVIKSHGQIDCVITDAKGRSFATPTASYDFTINSGLDP